MDRMDVRFYGTWHGRKFYRVLRNGRPIFTGTKGECTRFMRLHADKQAKELRLMTVPRRRKPFVKSYRVAPRRAGVI
ncbi:MAG: hypothetical protein ABFS86_06665 [Planctomycetota bacterium]